MPDDTAPPAKARPADPEPTHVLVLADGSTVESFGGIPTHIAVGDRAVRVVSVTER